MENLLDQKITEGIVFCFTTSKYDSSRRKKLDEPYILTDNGAWASWFQAACRTKARWVYRLLRKRRNHSTESVTRQSSDSNVANALETAACQRRLVYYVGYIPRADQRWEIMVHISMDQKVDSMNVFKKTNEPLRHRQPPRRI